MNPKSPAVIKLGGSLLTLPNLKSQLQEVVNSLSPQKALIVAGGGVAADEIRRLDERFGLTPKQAHWAAVAAMTFNSQILSRICGSMPIVAGRIDAQTAWNQYDAVLLDVSRFLRDEQFSQLHSRSLPESWSVTSDSIAAFVALHWPASQIVFCKSCDFSLQKIGAPHQDHLLDDWFPNLLSPLQQSHVKLSWLNLRAANPQPQPLLNSPDCTIPQSN